MLLRACLKKAVEAGSRFASALISTFLLTAVVLGAPPPAEKSDEAGKSGEAEKVDFQRHIRPILSDNCFHCHGPDENTREVGLRLDMRKGIFDRRDNGTPIVPGDLEASLLYKRVISEDPDWRMPHRKKARPGASFSPLNQPL